MVAPVPGRDISEIDWGGQRRRGVFKNMVIQSLASGPKPQTDASYAQDVQSILIATTDATHARFTGRKVMLNKGRYTGRTAIVSSVWLEGDGMLAFFMEDIQSTRKGPNGKRTIFGDHIDARRGYRLKEFNFLEPRIDP